MEILLKSKNNFKYEKIEFESSVFSGGEVNIRIKDLSYFYDVESIQLNAMLTDSNQVMVLAMLVDAIRRLCGKDVEINLNASYFPYARQDRVCNEGEALGVRVMADIINTMRFNRVVVYDAHSDVTTALLNNSINVTQEQVISFFDCLSGDLICNNLHLVSPDAGALKKTLNVSSAFKMSNPIIRADKKRNVRTLEIEETVVYGDVKGLDLLIVDDICDGGRTFIELAKVLKSKGAKSISLYVTHGIFSRGLEPFKGLIDKIYTIDSHIHIDKLIDMAKKSSSPKLIIKRK